MVWYIWPTYTKYALFPGCRYYSDLAGEEAAKKYQTLIFLAGSASAEFIADVALCPFEAVKVGGAYHICL